MTLTAKLWGLLDEATDRFMGIPKEERTTPDALKAAGEARGLSKAIHVMCDPHYEDSTAVAKQAIKRMKARQAGEEMPPTPGDMNDAQAMDAARAKEEETKAKAAPAKKAAPKKKAAAPTAAKEVVDTSVEARVRQELATLGEQQLKQIANGLRCNFEAEKLAELYNVSTETIIKAGEDSKE